MFKPNNTCTLLIGSSTKSTSNCLYECTILSTTVWSQDLWFQQNNLAHITVFYLRFLI